MRACVPYATSDDRGGAKRATQILELSGTIVRGIPRTCPCGTTNGTTCGCGGMNVPSIVSGSPGVPQNSWLSPPPCCGLVVTSDGVGASSTAELAAGVTPSSAAASGKEGTAFFNFFDRTRFFFAAGDSGAATVAVADCG